MLRAIGLLVAVLLAATACSGRSLYHYHRTVVGVDISGNVSDSTPSGRLTLGYSRRLVAAMPEAIQKAIEEAGKKPADTPTAAPVKPVVAPLPQTVFCTQVKASLGGVSSFREILATGAPADRYAEQISEASQLVSPRDRNFVCPGLVIPTPAQADSGAPAAEKAKSAAAATPSAQALPMPEPAK